MRGSAQPRELRQNTDPVLVLPRRGISRPAGDRALPLAGEEGPGTGEEKRWAVSGAQRGRARGGAERLGGQRGNREAAAWPWSEDGVGDPSRGRGTGLGGLGVPAHTLEIKKTGVERNRGLRFILF